MLDESASGYSFTEVPGTRGYRRWPIKSSRIARFVESTGDGAVFVGVDVHKRTYSVALSCVADGQVETWNCPADEAGLVEQLKELGCRIEHVVYETGPIGFSLCRALRGAGFNASVVAASRIPREGAPNSVGSSGETVLRVICVLGVEQTGIPALELRPERAIENLKGWAGSREPAQPV